MLCVEDAESTGHPLHASMAQSEMGYAPSSCSAATPPWACHMSRQRNTYGCAWANKVIMKMQEAKGEWLHWWKSNLVHVDKVCTERPQLCYPWNDGNWASKAECKGEITLIKEARCVEMNQTRTQFRVGYQVGVVGSHWERDGRGWSCEQKLERGGLRGANSNRPGRGTGGREEDTSCNTAQALLHDAITLGSFYKMPVWPPLKPIHASALGRGPRPGKGVWKAPQAIPMHGEGGEPLP